MGWVATAIDGKTTLTIGVTDNVRVVIHADIELDDDTALEIATMAAQEPIFWSDDRLCHWMFDFKAAGHWVEGLFHNNGLPDELNEFNPLHVRVYD